MRFVLFLFFCSQAWAIPGYHEPWGCDAGLKVSSPQAPMENSRVSPLAWTAEKIIWFHQNIISQADGPRSHFRPSSSGYMLEAIRKHGFIRGYLMGCDRLLRENNEEWIYRKVNYEGRTLKWDPPP